MPAGRERRAELAQIKHKDGRIDGHIEDAGREREPALLIAPEGPQRTAHPNVEAALGGNGGGKLSDHQCRGQAPEKGQQKQNADGHQEPRPTQNVLNSIRTAGHHEVGCGNQRQEAHLVPGGMKSKGHQCESNNRRPPHQEKNMWEIGVGVAGISYKAIA